MSSCPCFIILCACRSDVRSGSYSFRESPASSYPAVWPKVWGPAAGVLIPVILVYTTPCCCPLGTFGCPERLEILISVSLPAQRASQHHPAWFWPMVGAQSPGFLMVLPPSRGNSSRHTAIGHFPKCVHFMALPKLRSVTDLTGI